MNIDPLNQNLLSLFGESNIFVVPKYQRSYSWQPDNVIDFCEDLTKIYSAYNEGHTVEHFLGGFVCVKKKNDNELDEKKIRILVDGQQRLSTTSLLVSRIVKKLRAMDGSPELKDEIVAKAKKYVKRYVCYFPEENDTFECFRIELSRKDKVFFQELLLDNNPEFDKTTSPASHDLLLKATKEIDLWLQRFDGTNNAETLKNLDTLYKVLSSNCRIINILMTDVTDAYRLFQVINDRGRSLSVADLLRASTLGKLADMGATDDELLQAESMWDRITFVGDKSADYVLAVFFTSVIGEPIKNISIYDEYISRIFNVKDKDDLFTKIKEIDEARRCIDLLEDGAWPFDSKRFTTYQKHKLNVIVKIFKHKNAIPLLLAASRYKESKFFHIVFIIEKFFFRYKLALGKRFEAANKEYLVLIRAINKNKEHYSVQQFVQNLSSLLNKTNDDDFKGYLRALEYQTNNGDNRILKFILASVEESWDWLYLGKSSFKLKYKHHNDEIISEFTNLSIEHIYPQNPKVTVVAMEPFKHKLGNLTILTNKKNSLVGDENYDEKKDWYLKSGFSMTSAICKYNEWNNVNYVERTEELINKINDVFKLNYSNGE